MSNTNCDLPLEISERNFAIFLILVVLLAEILFSINGSAIRKEDGGEEGYGEKEKRGINEKYANLTRPLLQLL